MGFTGILPSSVNFEIRSMLITVSNSFEIFISILITSSIIGKTKAWVYVAWVTVFSTLAGLIYGAWVDGTSVWLLGLYLAVGLSVLVLGLHWISRLQGTRPVKFGARW